MDDQLEIGTCETVHQWTIKAIYSQRYSIIIDILKTKKIYTELYINTDIKYLLEEINAGEIYLIDGYRITIIKKDKKKIATDSSNLKEKPILKTYTDASQIVT